MDRVGLEKRHLKNIKFLHFWNYRSSPPQREELVKSKISPSSPSSQGKTGTCSKCEHSHTHFLRRMAYIAINAINALTSYYLGIIKNRLHRNSRRTVYIFYVMTERTKINNKFFSENWKYFKNKTRWLLVST